MQFNKCNSTQAKEYQVLSSFYVFLIKIYVVLKSLVPADAISFQLTKYSPKLVPNSYHVSDLYYISRRMEILMGRLNFGIVEESVRS
jgi:hypothetical protein